MHSARPPPHPPPPPPPKKIQSEKLKISKESKKNLAKRLRFTSQIHRHCLSADSSPFQRGINAGQTEKKKKKIYSTFTVKVHRQCLERLIRFTFNATKS
jgi:hypothetical protein